MTPTQGGLASLAPLVVHGSQESNFLISEMWSIDNKIDLS